MTIELLELDKKIKKFQKKTKSDYLSDFSAKNKRTNLELNQCFERDYTLFGVYLSGC
jgi:hypothetical protein